MLRKLSDISTPKLYTDEYDIEFAIMESKGNLVLDNIHQNIDSDMFEGEIRINKGDNNMIVKKDGYMNKLIVDANNDVKFERI